MSPRLWCPVCRGRVKPMARGLRQEFITRERACIACGKIWRLGRKPCYILSGLVIGLALAGMIGCFVKYKGTQADLRAVAWLGLCVAVVWPLAYNLLWQIKVRL